MSTGSRTQVLVAGAGVGGLSLAGSLERAGLEPVVVERAETLDSAHGAVELWAGAVRLLGQFDIVVGADGVTDARARDGAVEVDCIEPTVKSDAVARPDSAGATVTDIDTDAPSLERGFISLTGESTPAHTGDETPTRSAPEQP